jgi:hypothetical protein
MEQTPQHVAAATQEAAALRREAAALFPGRAFTDQELYAMKASNQLTLQQAEFRAIWDPPSAEIARRAVFAGTPVQGNLVTQPGPNTVQVRIERPTVRTSGAVMGGIQVGAGALNVYGGTQEEDPYLAALGIGGGSLQIVGGASWFLGAARTSAPLMSAGAKVCVVGSVVTAPITLVHAVEDLESGDPAREILGAEKAVGILFPPVGFLAVYSELVGQPAAEAATQVVGKSTSSDWSQIVGGPMAW